jgi:predicted MFS family arabinose efflux permease
MTIGSPATGRSTNRRWYVLAVLVAAVTLSYIDRYALAILIQPVKRDLRLTDTQIGWLLGFAFAATYAFVGVPVARYADRGRRRRVIAWSVAVWSLMTASCGFVQGFLQLAAARFGVGVGEAGALPASQSMVSQLFPPERRNIALALLACGSGLGLMIAFSLGSLLERWLGWRWTFVAVALPGILLLFLVRFTLPELPVASHEASSDPRADVRVSKGTLKELLANKIFRHLPFAQAANVVLLFGQAQWIPAYVERSFGASRAQIGPMLALMQGGAGLIGTLAGGIIADRLVRRGADGPIRLALLATVMGVVPMFAIYFVPNATQVYPLAGLMTLFLSMPSAAIFSTLQNAVPSSTRATAAAIAAMVAAVIGLGGGPLLIGFLSDHFLAANGAGSLRIALMVTDALAAPWMMFHLWRVLGALRQGARNSSNR